MLPSLQPPASLGADGVSKGRDQQGIQLSQPLSSAAPGSPCQAATGRNRGLGPWRDWEALQALMVARPLQPCPALPQQAACPLLFTSTGTLPPHSEHSCHSSACTLKLPAPPSSLHPSVLCTPVPCNPMCPSPPPPSSPLSPLAAREQGFPSPRAGAGRRPGGSVSGCQGQGCPWMHP